MLPDRCKAWSGSIFLLLFFEPVYHPVIIRNFGHSMCYLYKCRKNLPALNQEAFFETI